jgi:hypothetical protein
MSCLTAIGEEIIEVGAGIKNLRLELAPLRERVAQIENRLEEETHRLEALVLAGRASAHAPAMPKTVTPSPKKRTFAGTGFIRTLFDFMQAHPHQQVTPEGVASALGLPEKSGLAAYRATAKTDPLATEVLTP